MAQKYVFDPIGFVIATVITFLFVGFIFHWFDGIIAFTWLSIRVIAGILIIVVVIYFIYYLINRSKYGVTLKQYIRQWMPKNKDQNIKTYYDQPQIQSPFPPQSPKSIEPKQSEPPKVIISSQSKNLPNITIDDIDNMEGTEFERYLKRLFEKMGYSTDLTNHTTDWGADLILTKNGEKISVQAKRYSGNVGNDAVRDVVGSLKVYKTQRGIVVTNSDFTNPAIYQAHHCDVELWNRDKLIEMMNRYPVSNY